MYYVQFYQKSAISDDLIEASGDRSVIILDGRESQFAQTSIARQSCQERGYLAWQIFQGRSFSDSQAISRRYGCNLLPIFVQWLP